MSFRISNIIASVPTAAISTQTVTTTNLTTSEITETVVGQGIRIADITVTGNVIYAGGLAIKDTGSDYNITLSAPTLTANRNYIFPSSDGTAGQVLNTDGANHWGWTTVVGGTTDFLDSEFRVSNVGDGSRKLKFDAAAVAASTVRTITMPDADVTLANVPNQTVSTTSSPSFVAVTATTANANTVNTDVVSEKTALAGISLKSNAKKVFSIAPGILTTYDSAEYAALVEYPKTGTVASGALSFVVCGIDLGTNSICYIEITFIARNLTSGDCEVFKSSKILSRAAGAVSATDYVDTIVHTNWTGAPNSSVYEIKNARTANAKTYVADLKIMPLTTTSTYTVTYHSE